MSKVNAKRPSVAEKAKRGRRNERIMLLATVALASILTVGGTVAYLTAETGDVTNTMTPAVVTCAVTDGGSNNSDGEDICVKNTGNIDAYIRAAITVNWVKLDGSGNVVSIYGTPPVSGDGNDYKLTLGDPLVWDPASDGFFYHTSKVAPEANTGTLVVSCTQLSSATVPAGHVLMVDVVASAIQALPDDAVTSTWGVTMASDKSISK
ncbi:MAG: hypothetical protein IJO87_01575 [Eggerthellaceae bacterium]|nr:hypothetical protein [Eggerthellaceae bacterium]